MKIYKLSQEINSAYDTYDSCVVVAENEEEAIKLNPGGFREFSEEEDSWMFVFKDGHTKRDIDHTWVHPRDVKIKFIGIATKEIKKGVILTSFNAG